MFKKAFFLLVLFFLIDFKGLNYAFAYPGGVLNGETLYIGDNINKNNGTTKLATDNDESTGIQLDASTGINKFLWYKFNDPKSIISYQLRSTTTMSINLYDINGKILYLFSVSGDGVKRNLTNKIDNVYYVSLRNTSITKQTVYEFDVFTVIDTTPPDNVTKLNINVGINQIDLSFNPPTDFDFKGTKIYLNDVLVATLDKTKTSYSFADLIPNTTYTIKVTTFDETGNESEGVTMTARTKTPIVDNVGNLQADAKYDRVKLSWTRPDSEFFSHAKIYRKKVEQKSFWDQIFGTTSVSAETTSDGYTPMFETNGTYWTDLTVTPDTTYSYKVTSVNTEGNESQGVTIETTTPSEPVPTMSGVATTQNQNGDYVVTWTRPTKGTVKVLINGQEYTVVDAATQQVIIPKKDMKLNFFGGYDAKLVPIGEFGTEGEAVQVPTVGETKIDFPFSFNDFMQTVINILAWAAPLILLSFVLVFWRPLVEFIKKMLANAKGGRVKQ